MAVEFIKNGTFAVFLYGSRDGFARRQRIRTGIFPIFISPLGHPHFHEPVVSFLARGGTPAGLRNLHFGKTF